MYSNPLTCVNIPESLDPLEPPPIPDEITFPILEGDQGDTTGFNNKDIVTHTIDTADSNRSSSRSRPKYLKVFDQ